MSGGVDSSVAAALLLEQGYDVVGVTLKLWGGDSDSGCCSVSDVDDARRVAQQLGIDHHVFNFGDEFDTHVVEPYVQAHSQGLTPNPCIECNRHVKFDKLLRRADALGFDLVATGHHARIAADADGVRRVTRGADGAKDQSYVIYMLDQAQIARVVLPVGAMTKDDVRAAATRLGMRIANKPDSQDVCFITATGGRSTFLTDRMELTPGRVVDSDGNELATVEAVQLVTIGQRKGLGLAGGLREPRYVTDVDVASATVTVGHRRDLLDAETTTRNPVWSHEPVTGELLVQVNAHGSAEPADFDGEVIRWAKPHRRVAPGQSVVFYRGDHVVGGALVV